MFGTVNYANCCCLSRELAQSRTQRRKSTDGEIDRDKPVNDRAIDYRIYKRFRVYEQSLSHETGVSGLLPFTDVTCNG